MTDKPWEEDERSDDPDECDHADATVDVMTGELSCHCGYFRFLSAQELQREAQLQAEVMEGYYEECAKDGAQEVGNA